MIDERERIADILYEAEYDRLSIEQTVDRLQDAGVIYPPCKVGTEYFFPTWSAGIVSDVVKEIIFDGSTFVFNGKIAKFNEYDIGKRVFLTTEDAEKAWKEECDRHAE